MTDVEELCERVLLINEGQTLLYGRLDELKRSRGTHSVRIDAKRAPNTAPGATQVNGADGHYEYALAQGVAPETVFSAFVEAGIQVERYEVALPSLNDIFIEEVSRARGAR